MHIKYIQNIQFSINIRRSGLFNKIFEMNKIEQMNCHVLFKQVHTILLTALWKKKCVSGEHERLCAMKCRLGSGRISPQAGFEPATRRSKVGTARKPNLRPTTLPLFSNLTRGSYDNAQKVPRIKKLNSIPSTFSILIL